MDEELRKLIAKSCPTAEKALFSPRHLLPVYRQPDYINIDLVNRASFDQCVLFAASQMNPDSEISCSLINTLTSLKYDRPTLYLERELGEALIRTTLLSDVQIRDIRWRWPSYKIILPLGLLSLEFNGILRSIEYFEISEIKAGIKFSCPSPIGRELDELASRLSKQINNHRLERLEFTSNTDRICITVALSLARPDQAIYASLQPWSDEMRISDVLKESKLADSMAHDERERGLLNRLQHLMLNIAIFLSATPLIYIPEIIRKGRREGRHLKAELRRAIFVGQLSYRRLAISLNQAALLQTRRRQLKVVTMLDIGQLAHGETPLMAHGNRLGG